MFCMDIIMDFIDISAVTLECDMLQEKIIIRIDVVTQKHFQTLHSIHTYIYTQDNYWNSASNLVLTSRNAFCFS